MQTLLATVTILVLASVAKNEVAHAVSGWDPFAKIVVEHDSPEE